MSKPMQTVRKTKSATVKRMLSRKNGATLAEIEKTTCWKPHSCRAFLSVERKKGVTLTKEQHPNGQTAYRIVAVANPCPA